jgi:transposase
MLGTKSHVFALQPLLGLEQLVPTDDFYRFLDAKLDLAFVRDWVQDCYAERGRPSIDPVVFFKLQLILFFEGLRSERQLMRVVADRLSLRWYLGYDFGDPLPDHSSLTRIRTRYGRTVFQRFFEQVVELCRDAGLVWGEELIFDATKVRADADMDSLVPRFYWRAKHHVDDLFAAEGPPGEDVTAAPESRADWGTIDRPEVPRALPTSLTAEQEAQLAQQNEQRVSWLELQQHNPERPASGSYQRISDLRVSTTDPDATPISLHGHAVLGYQDHYVVDGGKHRVILAALVLPGDVRENTPFPDLTRRVCFRWGLRPKRAIGDGAYGTGENLRMLDDAGIRAYMPVVEREPRGPYFKHADFTYDPARDVYTCPQGTILPARGNNYDTHRRIYQAPKEACGPCPLRSRCTDSKEGRRLDRQFDEEYRERVRAYQGTPAYRKAMRKRQVWVEPLFGEAKDWHGLRRFRLRGLAKVNMEGLRIAAGQNLKRYLAAKGWGRRQGPCGSLVASSPTRCQHAVRRQSLRPRPTFSTGWRVSGTIPGAVYRSLPFPADGP